MNKPQQVLVSRLDVEGKRNGQNQRTVKDTLLISAWVTAYAGVLIIFRVTTAVESLLSSSRKGQQMAETNGQTWNRADASAQEESGATRDAGWARR